MRLSNFSDYSLRVLIHLNHTGDQITLNELSASLDLPRNHLVKIANRLLKLGYVETIRGRNGGLRIHEAAGRLPIGEIIQNTEQHIYLAECLSGGQVRCTLQKSCALKGCLQEAFGAFITSLNRRTLNDITPKR